MVLAMTESTTSMALGDKVGFWGPTTSIVDWCESNYATSYHIAEFWNTISNVFYIFPSLVAIWLAIRDRLETRFLACYVTLLIVGFGSWLFHMTLKYSSQLADEIPMLVLISIFLYTMATTSSPKNEINLTVLTGLVITVSTSAIVYIFIREPLIFQLSFTVLAVLLVVMCRIMSRQKHMQSIDKTLFYKAFIVMMIATLFWVLDKGACGHLRSLRSQMFSAGRPFTQFHMYWHILSSYAGFSTIAFLVFARTCHLGYKPHVITIMGFPFVRSRYSNNQQSI